MRSTKHPAASLDDLEDLKVVTKADYRRGYTAQWNGEPTRFRYKKVMTAADGHVVVCRPAMGEERIKSTMKDLRRGLGIFFVVAWPVTVLLLIGVVSGTWWLFDWMF